MSNKITLIGKVGQCPKLSHTLKDQKFYEFELHVLRKSGNKDKLLILFSDDKINVDSLKIGQLVEIQGKVRTYNLEKESQPKLKINVLCDKIKLLEEQTVNLEENNIVKLNGFICKQPIFRTTPANKKITDIILAVNEINRKSSYIPCITWGELAEKIKNCKVGENIIVEGRLQSRTYTKTLGDQNIERTAYEVSINEYTINTKKE